MAFTFFELAAVAAFAVQLVFSAATLYLNWQLRWYMVGDQALRIREGLWIVREQTITLANVQRMAVRQGPLRKLLGITDLEVHTAGGGSGAKSDGDEGSQPFHIARFRGLEDADHLRDRILTRLVLYKDTGRGDTDEVSEAGSSQRQSLGSSLRPEFTSCRKRFKSA